MIINECTEQSCLSNWHELTSSLGNEQAVATLFVSPGCRRSVVSGQPGLTSLPTTNWLINDAIVEHLRGNVHVSHEQWAHC